MSARPFAALMIVLYVAAFGVLAFYAARGWSYYRTPLEERPRHEDYWELKPGGSSGHALGVAGSTLMVLMLVYSVRKRVPGMRRFGQLRLWLHFHIFCGIVGPLLVVLHTSFKVGGLVALSFWSMIVVALSGVMGRYLYQQVPRRRSGDELTLAETRKLSEELDRHLTEDLGLAPERLEELEALARGDAGDAGERRGALRVLLALPWQSLALRARVRRFTSDLGQLPEATARELRRSLVRKVTLERRIALWNELQRLFYYWHLFHKPFAVIMYLFMVVHIGVAIATGYGGF